MRDNISMSVIRRLPRYYRFLGDLERQGITRISSKALAEKMGVGASQIRQDLNCFGGFGQQGYGYNIPSLKEQIAEILGIPNKYDCIIIGAGNLGRAIATHMNFEERGFRLTAVFDQNESLAGKLVSGLPIRHISGLDDYCRSEKPTVAMLCVPRSAAESLGHQLVRLGIKGIWNFTHYDFGEMDGVVVENVHLGDSMMTLCYNVTRNLEEK
ncbi:MAG: redox-sensing transcriptional repressor Rex [Acutalibacteraceae bacterium]|nr:redox-sensing transcriptional repressor Rex [Clostridia bacterium]MEE1127203.1 redox-sensing transcriptional repressor Rex [Acutalibacteraceae bacterium]